MERDLWVIAIESAVKEAQAGMIDFITGATENDPLEKTSLAHGISKDRSMSVRVMPQGRRNSIENATFEPPIGSPQSLSGSAAPSPSSLSRGSVSLHGPPARPSVSGAGTFGGARRSSTSASLSPSAFKDPRDQSVSDTDRDEEDVFSVERGNHMLMFGRVGRPQVIFLSCTKERLYWSKDSTVSKDDPFIELVEVESVRRGKVTEVLQKRSVDALSPPECCFSLILRNNRTLDFQCGNEEKRDRWVAALMVAVKRAKEDLLTQTMNRKRQEHALAMAQLRGGSVITKGQPLTRSQSLILPKSVRTRASIIDHGLFSPIINGPASGSPAVSPAGDSPTNSPLNSPTNSPVNAPAPIPASLSGGVPPMPTNASPIARRVSSLFSPEYASQVEERSIAETEEADEEDFQMPDSKEQKVAGKKPATSPTPSSPGRPTAAVAHLVAKKGVKITH